MSDKANIMMKVQRTGAFETLKNQRGATAVEYAVILVFTVVVVIAVIMSLEDSSSLLFSATEETVGNFGRMEPE